MNSDTQLLAELLTKLGFGIALGVVTLASMVVVAALFIKSYVERLATARIDQKLEQEKQQLQLSADSVRFDMQRRLADFGIFNTQRHRIYRRLFRRALQAEGAYAKLSGTMREVDYSEASLAEVTVLLQEYTVSDLRRSEILTTWDSNRNAANLLLDKAIERSKERKARQAFQVFKNEFLLGEIYISQAVRDALNDFNMRLAASGAEIAVPSSGMRRLELRREAESAIYKLRNAMIEDLKRGDYDAQVDSKLPVR